MKFNNKTTTGCKAASKEMVGMKHTPNYPAIASMLFTNGFLLCQITPHEKYPFTPGWQNADTEALLKTWKPGHGIGIRTGKYTGIDIDVLHPDVVFGLLQHFGGIEILTRQGQPPKTLIPVICPEITKKITSNKWIDEHGQINQIECLSYGQQFVAYGIHPGTGKPYQWSGDLLKHDIPEVSLEFVHSLFALFEEQAKVMGWTNLSAKTEQAHTECKRKPRGNTGKRPGDLFNRAVSVDKVLKGNGWRHYREKYWTRPGKKFGVSGVVFPDGLFVNFSSSVLELAERRPYDAFGLLTALEYNGDFSAAADAVNGVAR